MSATITTTFAFASKKKVNTNNNNYQEEDETNPAREREYEIWEANQREALAQECKKQMKQVRRAWTGRKKPVKKIEDFLTNDKRKQLAQSVTAKARAYQQVGRTN